MVVVVLNVEKYLQAGASPKQAKLNPPGKRGKRMISGGSVPRGVLQYLRLYNDDFQQKMIDIVLQLYNVFIF